MTSFSKKFLEVKLIDFAHKKNKIFNAASMKISEREIIGILGPNGSGKTTLFDLICNISKPNSGLIYNTFERQSYLSQTITTPPLLKMHEIFTMASSLTCEDRHPETQTLNKLKKLAPEIVGRYNELLKKKSAICSYGEKRWFFALLALTNGSDLVILDEPTAGVDPEFRHYIWKCIKGFSMDGGAVLVSSHNTEEIIQNCTCFYMISNKKLKKYMSKDSFLSAYHTKTLDEAFIAAASAH